MSADQYLSNIIIAKKAPDLSLNDWRLTNIKSIINAWAGAQLNELKQSGSSAKGTAVHSTSDFDIFISLKSDTTQTLKEIYNSLDNIVKGNGITTRRQNVSIGITQVDLSIDLVPGKKQAGYQNYHSIYSSKKDTWLQTNIDLHITKVLNSNRRNEIILTKIWRHIHGIEFPSIYLELTVLDALYNKPINDLANNFLTILGYLKDSFIESTVEDPANTNNIISDMLYKYEKEAISNKAKECLNKENWSEIIW
jgi:predicted nucleotidyltransferase